jgi:hypothetical protein
MGENLKVHFYIYIIYLFTKQAAFLRRSTVLSLPLQLVFPGTGMCVSLGIIVLLLLLFYHYIQYI